MGWTWQQAKHYRRGKIDRKAECDAYFSGINADCYIVEKSAMIGTVYYAAVRIIGKHNFKDNTSIPIPVNVLAPLAAASCRNLVCTGSKTTSDTTMELLIVS